MNEYINNIVGQLKQLHFRRQLEGAEKLISRVQEHLYDIKSEKDKLDLLTSILETNELKYLDHLETCENKEDCGTNKEHIKVNYFLQQELEELGVISTDNFTREEKESSNQKLDEILQTILNANQIVSEQVEELKAEIRELKHLYVLGKKNWKQQFGGKLTSLMLSGVITEASAKPIIENVLKPGVDFITGRLLS